MTPKLSEAMAVLIFTNIRLVGFTAYGLEAAAPWLSHGEAMAKSR